MSISLFLQQESHIKIYDVDHGWKVHKDIRARSLRWTITDTCLSPDRRFLVRLLTRLLIKDSCHL